MYRPVLDPDIANVRAMSISFHLLGFHRHWRNALTADESNMEVPVDLSAVTLVTEPVFKLSVARNSPLPSTCAPRGNRFDHIIHPRRTPDVVTSAVQNSFCIHRTGERTRRSFRPHYAWEKKYRTEGNDDENDRLHLTS
jgi:hypothetical protein